MTVDPATASDHPAGAIGAGQPASPGYTRYVIVMMAMMTAVNFMDRSVLHTIGVSVAIDLQMSNTQLGLLQGPAFAFLYSILAVPVARFADRHSRITIISCALMLWSMFTVG